MATTNPVVSSLPSYVEQLRLPLLAKSVLGGKSISLFNLETGVKGKTALNLLNTEITFQDANDCGFNATGSQTLTQRYIEPAYLKVNMQYCDKKFLGTWAQYQVKIAAGTKTLPFEEDFTNDVVKHVNESLEHLVYWGDADNTAEFDGLITILQDSSVVIDASAGATKWDTLKNVYEAIPETEIKDDTAILVAPGYFRGFIQELVAANMYHYDANDGAGEYRLPGTNVRVISVDGLIDTSTNKDVVIGGRLSNIYYGTDLANDEEKFDFWYDKDSQLFKLAIEFTAGVQVAFPDKMVLYKEA